MTFRSETGYIFNPGVWLCGNSAEDTVDQMCRSDHLALGIVDKARFKVAVRAVDVRVDRSLPIVVVRIHNMTGVAKARLPGNNQCRGAKKGHQHNQQQYSYGPPHLSEDIHRRRKIHSYKSDYRPNVVPLCCFFS